MYGYNVHAFICIYLTDNGLQKTLCFVIFVMYVKGFIIETP